MSVTGPSASNPPQPAVDDDAPPPAAPPPAAPPAPAPSAPPRIGDERRRLADALHDDPAWAAVPAATQRAIDNVVSTEGSPALAGELRKLIAQPGFSTRLVSPARDALVELVRIAPERAADVNRSYGDLANFFSGTGYSRLAPEDQERTRMLLSDKPSVARPLADLVNDPAFRALGQDDKSALFQRIGAAPDAQQAAALIGLEKSHLAVSNAAADVKAQQVLKYLDVLQKGESPWTSVAGGLLGGPILGLGGLAIGPLANALGQGHVKDKIADLLSGPDADAVWSSLENHAEGRVHDLMSQLVEKPGSSDTRTRLSRILGKLDPDNSAKFLSDMSHAVGKELKREDVFDAVAKGFKLSGNVGGAQIGIENGAVAVGAPDFSVGGVPVKDLKLSFDPGPLRQTLAKQKEKDYQDLLTEVLDGFTKNHELMSSPQRWDDAEKREYFDAIRRLPGGQGASEIAAPVARPPGGPATPP
jgi:hypothetical protein